MNQYRQSTRNQNKYKMQRSRCRRSTQDSHHHGWPVVRVARPCCLARTAVHSPLLPVYGFSLRLYDFLLVFVLKCQYLAAEKTRFIPPNSSHSTILLHPLDQSSFREKRSRGEDCKDTRSGLGSKDSRAFLVELSFPSLLFSQPLDLCFVI